MSKLLVRWLERRGFYCFFSGGHFFAPVLTGTTVLGTEFRKVCLLCNKDAGPIRKYEYPS